MRKLASTNTKYNKLFKRIKITDLLKSWLINFLTSAPAANSPEEITSNQMKYLFPSQSQIIASMLNFNCILIPSSADIRVKAGMLLFCVKERTTRTESATCYRTVKLIARNIGLRLKNMIDAFRDLQQSQS